MLETFYPGEYLDSVYQVDFDRLYQKGCRGVIFDIDNTLVEHGAPADLSHIHNSEPTRHAEMSYSVFCVKKK